jgi:hypothetical protein
MHQSRENRYLHNKASEAAGRPVPWGGSSTQDNSAVQSEASRFDFLDLKAGMDREKVEEQVSALLSKPMTYSPYGNPTRDGPSGYAASPPVGASGGFRFQDSVGPPACNRKGNRNETS